MWWGILFLSLIAVAGVTPAAHADSPLTFEDYYGPFWVSFDSTAITLNRPNEGDAPILASINKELLALAKPAMMVHCVLVREQSDDPEIGSKFWVSHIYVNIRGEDIPVSVDGKILFGGKNLVLTITDIQFRPESFAELIERMRQLNK